MPSRWSIVSDKCNQRGTTGKSYGKGLLSSFDIDTFAQADINSFGIMVSSDRHGIVARNRGGVGRARGGVASTTKCLHTVTS